MDDTISRQWLMERVEEGWIKFDTQEDENRFVHLIRDIAPSAQPEEPSYDAVKEYCRKRCLSIVDTALLEKYLPSAEPNLSEAYSKAVFTWLTKYQTIMAELKGRYTPYEVLSWVINDWRKENG